MIRLGTSIEPPWLDLPHGVRVQLKAFDAACDIAAQRAIAVSLRDGGSPDEAEAAGFLVVAQRRIVAWEGVQSEHGGPAECTPANVLSVMLKIPGMLAHFREGYLLWCARWSAEGNGSATSPNGISARGPSTAADA